MLKFEKKNLQNPNTEFYMNEFDSRNYGNFARENKYKFGRF